MCEVSSPPPTYTSMYAVMYEEVGRSAWGSSSSVCLAVGWCRRTSGLSHCSGRRKKAWLDVRDWEASGDTSTSHSGRRF